MNPRQGIETDARQQVGWRHPPRCRKTVNPRQGIETSVFLLYENTVMAGRKTVNPRQGIETQRLFVAA